MSNNPFSDSNSDNPFRQDPTNPYQPTPGLANEGVINARARLLPPAIVLIAFSVMTILASLAQIPRVMSEAGDHGGAGYVVGSFLPAFMNFVVICGSVQMIRLKSHSSAMTAAVISLIPFCSPCFFLGIPFGIWALVVLRNPAVKAQFTS